MGGVGVADGGRTLRDNRVIPYAHKHGVLYTVTPRGVYIIRNRLRYIIREQALHIRSSTV